MFYFQHFSSNSSCVDLDVVRQTNKLLPVFTWGKCWHCIPSCCWTDCQSLLTVCMSWVSAEARMTNRACLHQHFTPIWPAKNTNTTSSFHASSLTHKYFQQQITKLGKHLRPISVTCHTFSLFGSPNHVCSSVGD